MRLHLPTLARFSSLLFFFFQHLPSLPVRLSLLVKLTLPAEDLVPTSMVASKTPLVRITTETPIKLVDPTIGVALCCCCCRCTFDIQRRKVGGRLSLRLTY